MSAAVLAAIGAVFIAVTEQDASKDLEAARAALERAREFEEDIEAYNRAAEETRRAVELYTAMNVMRQVIEQAVRNPDVNTVKAIELCLQTARRPLLIAFGFELEGHWTLAIYIAEKNSAYKQRSASPHCTRTFNSLPDRRRKDLAGGCWSRWRCLCQGSRGDRTRLRGVGAWVCLQLGHSSEG